VIIAFRHKGLKRLYEQGDRSKLPADMIDKIETILAALDAATLPEHLDRPSFRLHPLTGDRKGQWAVTVRANWRIVFAFEGSNVIEVDFVDYH
jgi:proteic killer suppression protein